MGRAGDRVSSKQGQQGMSYGQGRRQGQQQTEPARNELWSWAGDRVSSKQGPQGMSYGQGPRQGQQQAGPAGRSATDRAGCGWAMGRAGNKQGWRHARPAARLAKDRAGSRDSDTQGQRYVGPAAGQATGGRPQGEQWAGSAAVRHEQGRQQAGPNINVMSCPWASKQQGTF